jgi:hypothetical protein
MPPGLSQAGMAGAAGAGFASAEAAFGAPAGVGGCHTSFYRKRCLVCERPMECNTEHQLVCGKRACRKALRAKF